VRSVFDLTGFSKIITIEWRDSKRIYREVSSGVRRESSASDSIRL
jgi:hypothetical protein